MPGSRDPISTRIPGGDDEAHAELLIGVDLALPAEADAATLAKANGRTLVETFALHFAGFHTTAHPEASFAGLRKSKK